MIKLNEDIEKLKDEHFNTYKNAVIANIENNSTILVKEDPNPLSISKKEIKLYKSMFCRVTLD